MPACRHPSVWAVIPSGFMRRVLSRGARRRQARDIAAAVALPVDQIIADTVLYRPSAPGGSFSGCPRLMLTQALSSRPGVAATRVNHKRNVVAADASTQECLEQLPTIKELRGIPVTAREPADRKTSTRYLHGHSAGACWHQEGAHGDASLRRTGSP
ncbi:hypothetical protein MRX96_040735 [Rhipicephalus microplus]